jgi:hypothetical protein
MDHFLVTPQHVQNENPSVAYIGRRLRAKFSFFLIFFPTAQFEHRAPQAGQFRRFSAHNGKNALGY